MIAKLVEVKTSPKCSGGHHFKAIDPREAGLGRARREEGIDKTPVKQRDYTPPLRLVQQGGNVDLMADNPIEADEIEVVMKNRRSRAG